MKVKVEGALQRQLLKRTRELRQKYRYPFAIAYRTALREAMRSDDVIVVNGEARYIRASKNDGRACA